MSITFWTLKFIDKLMDTLGSLLKFFPHSIGRTNRPFLPLASIQLHSCWVFSSYSFWFLQRLLSSPHTASKSWHLQGVVLDFPSSLPSSFELHQLLMISRYVTPVQASPLNPVACLIPPLGSSTGSQASQGQNFWFSL